MKKLCMLLCLFSLASFQIYLCGCSGSQSTDLPDGTSSQTADPLTSLYSSAADADGDLLNDEIDDEPEKSSIESARDSKWFYLESFDGTKIECRVMLPAGKGPFPVIMAAHGWASSASSTYGYANMFRQHGYASLVWSARGWGKSGGIIRLDSSQYEVKDVIRIINWLSEQPFVIRENNPSRSFENSMLVDFDFNMDGMQEDDDVPGDESRDFILGMSGESYGGAIQVMSASYDRRIDAISSRESWVDLHAALMPGDSVKVLWTLGFLAGGLMRQQEGSGLDNDLTNWLTWVYLTKNIPDDMRRGLRLRSPSVRLELVNVPVLTINGKYDTCFDLNQSATLFESARNRGYDAKMYWFSGGHSYTPRFGGNISRFQIDWMEKHLKKRSIDTGPEFVYDIQNGDGTWRTAASGWPVVDSTRETRLFLHGSFKGNSLKISQKFLFEFPGSAVANVPLAKTSLTEISGQGMLPEEYHFIPFDSPLTSSEFISEPFEYDTEITGIPKANLWLSGIGRDITFFIKLYIIDGNGSVSPSDSARIKDIRIKDLIEDIKEMADNQQARPGEDDLSSHHITPFKIPPSEPFEASGESSVMKFNLNDYNRASDEFWNDLLSGKPISGLLSDIPIFELDKPAGIIKPTLYSFDLRGMSRVIKKGQRIKLIIATSDFCYSHSRLPAVGIIWHSAKYPSSINLPIVRD